MGGQACVFYGAAQVSKDIDLLLLTSGENMARLRDALAKLDAKRIAVPRFDPEVLERGHAVHFRSHAPGTEELRIDLMTRLRDLPDFAVLWERRTVIADDSGDTFDLLSIPDLVDAKKTQRTKDWPIIELLVAIHFRENIAAPTADWITFWLREARTPNLIVDLCARFPTEAHRLAAARPLLSLAISGDMEALRPALDAEVRVEQAKDREYWAPLKRELEEFRRQERENRSHSS